MKRPILSHDLAIITNKLVPIVVKGVVNLRGKEMTVRDVLELIRLKNYIFQFIKKKKKKN